MIAIQIIAGVWLCFCAASAVALLLLARDAPIVPDDDEPQPESDPDRIAATRAAMRDDLHFELWEQGR